MRFEPRLPIYDASEQAVGSRNLLSHVTTLVLLVVVVDEDRLIVPSYPHVKQLFDPYPSTLLACGSACLCQAQYFHDGVVAVLLRDGKSIANKRHFLAGIRTALY